MASMNKVILVGNLTKDLELRRIQSGTAVTTMRMAVDDSFTNKSGERVERTVFLDVDVWDRTAENCVKYLSKGSPVLVEGRLQLDTWEDRESGQKRSMLKVRAERVQFLSSPGYGGGERGGSGGGGGDRPARDRPPETPPPQSGTYNEPLADTPDEDDVPF